MADPDSASQPEDDMLPDERDVIAERAEDLDDLDAEEFLSTDELADALGIERRNE